MLGDAQASVWELLREDFVDLGSPGLWIRLAVRLAFAAVLGGALGWQREQTGKAAGLRTHMLVATGAALFVAAADEAGIGKEHLSRVIQGIVTGIGFVGGGAILKLTEQRQIKGLTTATGIWLTAAVGVACGLGREVSGVIGTGMALLILAGLVRLERQIDAATARRQEEAPHTHQ